MNLLLKNSIELNRNDSCYINIIYSMWMKVLRVAVVFVDVSELLVRQLRHSPLGHDLIPLCRPRPRRHAGVLTARVIHPHNGCQKHTRTSHTQSTPRFERLHGYNMSLKLSRKSKGQIISPDTHRGKKTSQWCCVCPISISAEKYARYQDSNPAC